LFIKSRSSFQAFFKIYRVFASNIMIDLARVFDYYPRDYKQTISRQRTGG